MQTLMVLTHRKSTATISMHDRRVSLLWWSICLWILLQCAFQCSWNELTMAYGTWPTGSIWSMIWMRMQMHLICDSISWHHHVDYLPFNITIVDVPEKHTNVWRIASSLGSNSSSTLFSINTYSTGGCCLSYFVFTAIARLCCIHHHSLQPPPGWHTFNHYTGRFRRNIILRPCGHRMSRDQPLSRTHRMCHSYRFLPYVIILHIQWLTHTHS